MTLTNYPNMFKSLQSCKKSDQRISKMSKKRQSIELLSRQARLLQWQRLSWCFLSVPNSENWFHSLINFGRMSADLLQSMLMQAIYHQPSNLFILTKNPNKNLKTETKRTYFKLL